MILKYRQEAKDEIIRRACLVVTYDHITGREEYFMTVDSLRPEEFILIPDREYIRLNELAPRKLFTTRYIPSFTEKYGLAHMQPCVIYEPQSWLSHRSSLVWVGNNSRGCWAFKL